MRADHSRVPHPCATVHCCTVRLACLIHAASVRSEPGSNSPNKIIQNQLPGLVSFFKIQSCRKSCRFAFIYYDFAVLFRTSKSFSRVHRTIQFSKSFANVFSTSASLFSKLRFAYQAQRGFNLAPFFDLSNQFLIFFKSFFSTASFKLSSF